MLIHPDRRLYTKTWLVLGSITVVGAVAAGVAHVVMLLLDVDNPARALTVLWSVVGGVLLALWCVGVPVAWLWIRNLSYEITDSDVLIHKGILTKIEQSIPLRMITDFRLNRSLYDRWLGIGSLDVQTAGQSANSTGYEGRLSGLADWQGLHADLKARLRAFRDLPAPVGPDRGEGGSEPLLAEVREIRRLLERAGR